MPPNGLSLLFGIKIANGGTLAHFKLRRYFSAIIMDKYKAVIFVIRFTVYPVSIMNKKTLFIPAAGFLQEFLQKDDKLSGMLTYASRLMDIRQACEAALPAWFIGDILQFEKGRLTIGVPSQALAARLRQKTPFLQAALQQAGWPVESIRIKVKLRNDPWQPKPAPKKTLPDVAIVELTKLSSWLKEAGNPALAKAIDAMLARHQQKKA